MRPVYGLFILLLTAFPAWAAMSNDTLSTQTDLTELSLEALMDIEVTSVSKRPQRLFESAAAVFVITGEDIRRSGARSIPEALRLAPGISVAQIDANKWAITSRGFNSRFSDKLLVLMDGRINYSPSTSGVFWDVQHYPLEDIDRIEVIRGPGGTLWGDNAVNGVINIITKDARDTEGGYITAGGGSEERGFGTIRYGHRIVENGSVRAYVDYFTRDHLYGGYDAWEMGQVGFRGDWDWSKNHFTMQGDYYRGEERQRQVVPRVTPPYLPVVNEKFDVSGGNVLARYKRQKDAHSDLQLQLYYDRTDRDELAFAGTRDTVDLDYQHRFPILPGHDFIYGFNFRYFHDKFTNDPSSVQFYDPAKSDRELYSGFLQDEIPLFEDRFRLTLGTKLEYNDFTEWEVQPNIRGTWLPSPRHVVWTAISRAVKVPLRNFDVTSLLLPVVIPPSDELPLPIFINGGNPLNRLVDAEELIAYEAGYRVQPTDQLSLDLAGFYNDYDNLVTGELGAPELGTPPTHLIIQTAAKNGGTGKTYGFELTAEWRPTDAWRLVGTYSFLKNEFDLGGDAATRFAEDKDPRHQASLRVSGDLPGNITLDLWGRFVDDLPSFAADNVEEYFDLDVRLGWRPTKDFEVALVGQNLVESQRFEFGASDIDKTLTSGVQRAFYVQLSYEF